MRVASKSSSCCLFVRRACRASSSRPRSIASSARDAQRSLWRADHAISRSVFFWLAIAPAHAALISTSVSSISRIICLTSFSGSSALSKAELMFEFKMSRTRVKIPMVTPPVMPYHRQSERIQVLLPSKATTDTGKATRMPIPRPRCNWLYSKDLRRRHGARTSIEFAGESPQYGLRHYLLAESTMDTQKEGRISFDRPNPLHYMGL